jgi:predicted ATPase
MAALRRFVISGCSGGGKSSLISELAKRGKAVVPEAGRFIVKEEMASGGHALPWGDKLAFVSKLAAMGAEQYSAVSKCIGDVFFDRSIIEVEVFCDLHDLELPQAYASFAGTHRYADPIFLVPPWQEIFASDAERQHSFQDAVLEYDALALKFLEKGYRVAIIPQDTIENRADWILSIIYSTA